MNRYGLLASAIVALTTVPGLAQQADPVATLSGELKAHAPPQWQVRVRWREGQLLASITPLPYDTAFQLWYEPDKLQAALTAMCPAPDDEIWKLIRPDQEVILEPTVGGKSAMEARVNCRMARATPECSDPVECHS